MVDFFLTVLAVVLGNALFQWMLFKLERFLQELDSFGNDDMEDYNDEQWL